MGNWDEGKPILNAKSIKSACPESVLSLRCPHRRLRWNWNLSTSEGPLFPVRYRVADVGQLQFQFPIEGGGTSRNAVTVTPVLPIPAQNIHIHLLYENLQIFFIRYKKTAAYFAEEIVVHPGYHPKNHRHDDLALVRVGRPFEFSSTVMPVCLPLGPRSAAFLILIEYLLNRGQLGTESCFVIEVCIFPFKYCVGHSFSRLCMDGFDSNLKDNVCCEGT